ncbi:hypothetical protein [Haladaptatus sp. NG-SE-30]
MGASAVIGPVIGAAAVIGASAVIGPVIGASWVIGAAIAPLVKASPSTTKPHKIPNSFDFIVLTFLALLPIYGTSRSYLIVVVDVFNFSQAF